MEKANLSRCVEKKQMVSVRLSAQARRILTRYSIELGIPKTHIVEIALQNLSKDMIEKKKKGEQS